MIYRHHGLCFVAIEQSQASQILSEFALHADLDQIVLEQHAVVLEYESTSGWQLKRLIYYLRAGSVKHTSLRYAQLDCRWCKCPGRR